MSKKRQTILLVSLGAITLIAIIFAIFINTRPKQEPQLLVSKSDIVDYRPLSEESAIYTTRSNSVGVVSLGGSNKEVSYSNASSVRLSPTGSYYSVVENSTVTIYTSSSNTAIQSFQVQQFVWQGNDSYIFSRIPTQTSNPNLAVDDVDQDSLPLAIFFAENIKSTPSQVASKSSNGLLQYSMSNKTLTFLAPDIQTNPLQNSIITQSSPSQTNTFAQIVNSQLRSFLPGNILTDQITGSFLISGSTITKMDNFTTADTVSNYQGASSILHINSNQSNHSLEATNISTKKTTIISLSMPDFFSNQTVDLPYTVDNTLMFRSNTGLFTYKLP